MIPEVGARIMDLQDPDTKMSTSYGTDAGLVYIDDEPDAIVRKIKRAQTDSGQRGGARPGQGRHLEPDRHLLRGARRRAGAGGARVRRARATARSSRRWARRWSSCWRRCASATPSCAPTRPRSRPSSQEGAERAREIATGVMTDVRGAMGVGPPV